MGDFEINTDPVVDFDTGDILLLGVPYSGPAGPQFVWSADRRWVFWVDSRRVKAWSPDPGGEPLELADVEAGVADLIAVAPS